MAKPTKPETFGEKLARLRVAKGLSRIELARKLNLKPEYLEKLERNQVLPSVAEILILARSLSVEPSSFMLAEKPESGEEKRKKALEQRAQDYAYKLLSPPDGSAGQTHLMAFEVKIDPQKYHRKVAYQHSGEEFIYVLSGRLWIKVGQKVHLLGPGQSLHFDSGKKHLLKNPGKTQTTLLVIIYTP